MIKVKLYYIIMPWQIDYALLSYMQLKKSFTYLNDDVEITIDTHLNLSNYLIDWENSTLPKKFFINKFKELSQILLTDYKVNEFIYEGDDNYGLLDTYSMARGEEFDYYIPLAPDVEFDETTLSYLIEAIREIPNKYSAVITEIYKKWDWTWDDITNENFKNVPYNEWDKGDIFKLRKEINDKKQPISIQPALHHKWAAWFDIYNKAFYEELCPTQEGWVGYGPWDLYSMTLSGWAKKLFNVDVGVFILRGKVIFEYDHFTNYYKEHIKTKIGANEQRAAFEAKLPEYYQNAVNTLREKNIII